jgi:CRISPR-associated endonuclease/helicase Cas3
VDLLAHSGQPGLGVPAQTYASHVASVRERAAKNMKAALAYRGDAEPAFLSSTEWASVFHDLGKLDPQNQAVLQSSGRDRLPINHVDAGVAHLCDARQVEAALAAYGHHRGLCDLIQEKAKGQRNVQNPAEHPFRDPAIKLHNDEQLPALLTLHHQCMLPISESICFSRALSGLERRLLLSCLVDADHGDTAAHYGESGFHSPSAPRWSERLAALDRYVQKLGEGGAGTRSELRGRIYEACRSASPEEPFYACEAPVGSGKTTAVMSYLLQAAVAMGLRHIFVVLPYTNIVEQAVNVYRSALVLPGEDPERTVAAHHHQAEFADPNLRHLSTLWDCPIIVTTSVQFFETLAASHTARLRKFHQLPGSAVFVDEAHAAVPIHIWPFMWNQALELAENWSCRFVFGSGSLARFWENTRILGAGKTRRIPSMLSTDLAKAGNASEQSRVSYKSRPAAMTLCELRDWVLEHEGPRLVIMNTVQSAAAVARELRSHGVTTLHMSTALAPVHRKQILRRVLNLLDVGSNTKDWVLVATSCVEAGVDLSFKVAFRECARVASLIQIGGRVNRHGELDQSVVWDFVVSDPQLPPHPDFRYGQEVVQHVFAEDMWHRDTSDLMTYALEQEFKRHAQEDSIKKLLRQERLGAYPDVARMSRLITADTRLVVIDPSMIQDLRSGVDVNPIQLLLHSVQMWSTKITALALSPIGFSDELYAWEYPYDAEFLGIMKGVFQQQSIASSGYAMV